MAKRKPNQLVVVKRKVAAKQVYLDRSNVVLLFDTYKAWRIKTRLQNHHLIDISDTFEDGDVELYPTSAIGISDTFCQDICEVLAKRGFNPCDPRKKLLFDISYEIVGIGPTIRNLRIRNISIWQ
ncbi:MAG: hypothetical protein NTW79_00460 [Candidatus Berkelbacteria bacterium]|nr:hypothetical protein [Candidatus Berkelbacteria bacterium]